jgi:hypothetical protein
MNSHLEWFEEMKAKDWPCDWCGKACKKNGDFFGPTFCEEHQKIIDILDNRYQKHEEDY